jgi:hypothetical protein
MLQVDAGAAAPPPPAALFYVATRHFDFVHFSSEQLPVFLIAGSVYFLVWRPLSRDYSTALFCRASLFDQRFDFTPINRAIRLAVLSVYRRIAVFEDGNAV